MPGNELTLDEALRWAKSLSRPSPHAFKNAMRLVGSLIRSGKAKGGKYNIPISLKQAFQRHTSMAGKPMKRLADKRHPDRDKPLYRKAKRSRSRGRGTRVVRKAVDTLYKIMTKKKFSHKGGRHVEFYKGGLEPQMVFGGSGVLPSVHQHGQKRTIITSKGPQTINLPSREFIDVTSQLANQSAEIMADEAMQMIKHGAF